MSKSRTSLLPLFAVAAVAVTAATSAVLPSSGNGHRPPKPTIVLVHGAFADSSSWNGVVQRLRKDDYPVYAVANPLRGIKEDTAYLASHLAAITGPIVLVGHSYGGAVITNAAAADPDVTALVYIAAFAPTENESLGDLIARPVAHPIEPTPLVAVDTTDAEGVKGTDFSIDPVKFRFVFAADVDRTTAANMATAQRPVSGAAFGEPTTRASWRSLPSWTLITRQDKAISPDLQRFMAERAHARTVEVDSSHAVMVSHPDVVVRLIEAATRAVVVHAS